MGRPRTDRTELVQIKVTPKQKIEWRIAAAACDMGMSEFIAASVGSSDAYHRAAIKAREIAAALV